MKPVSTTPGENPRPRAGSPSAEQPSAGSVQRREAFLRDVSAAMRLLNGPEHVGERFCTAPQWEQDLHNAGLWCDPAFVQHFAVEDYPELLPATRSALVAAVGSFRRAATPCPRVAPENRTLASTHLATICDRLQPLLQAYWRHRAGARPWTAPAQPNGTGGSPAGNTWRSRRSSRTPMRRA